MRHLFRLLVVDFDFDLDLDLDLDFDFGFYFDADLFATEINAMQCNVE